MYILTNGWVTLHKDPNFDIFSELDPKDKRIYHLIDGKYLPDHVLIRIYQKEKNIVLAIRTIQWMFKKNRYFPKSTFDTLATVTPTRVFSSNIQTAGIVLCDYLGFPLRTNMNKILFRQILKKGKEAHDKYIEEHSYACGISLEEAKIFTDDYKLFATRVKENQELYDLFNQAITLDKRIKMSWSDRKIHDMHMKWTAEIHKIKYRNCSSDAIWKNIPVIFDKVELLNSERRIAEEGLNMHHCIYTNYGNSLKTKTKIAFHVAIEDSFTVMFDIYDGGKVVFNQAYHAWNKSLTSEEKQMAEDLVEYASLIVDANPLEQKQELDLPDLFN